MAAASQRILRPQTTRLTKATSVNLRVDAQQLALIDNAAEALGTNRSAFLLETAMHRAESVLLDKRLFVVGDDTYDRFLSRLDAPPTENPNLRALLTSKAPWAP